MKTVRTMLAVAAACFVLAALGTSASAAGIQDTKHNLGSTGTKTIHVDNVTNAQNTGTSEICVFCHTPHAADTEAKAPLWNRAATTATFTIYNSPSFDATWANGGQPTGVSLACLSCHDGTVAFDALRNQPGSGTIITGDNTSAGWLFTGTTGNTMPTNIVANLSNDLRDDHPISMQYSTAASPGGTNGTNDFNTGFRRPDNGSNHADCNNPNIGLDSKDCYFNNGVKIVSGYVQCTSCHDPHRQDTPTFLRTANTGSAVCLTCHKKDA